LRFKDEEEKDKENAKKICKDIPTELGLDTARGGPPIKSLIADFKAENPLVLPMDSLTKEQKAELEPLCRALNYRHSLDVTGPRSVTSELSSESKQALKTPAKEPKGGCHD
jgi:hypothetical protein